MSEHNQENHNQLFSVHLMTSLQRRNLALTTLELESRARKHKKNDLDEAPKVHHHCHHS